ncbi:MAG: PorT family protein [Saprospiraceae bacterium]|nr:PorT family protein [Saprospiraceae bacterium]
MFNLYSRKVVVHILLFTFFTGFLYGQVRSRDNYNYLDFQGKSYYFGMAFGTNISGYKINQSKFFIGNDSIQIAEGKRKGGFNIHMIANLKMGEYFDFRFLPGFAFSYRSFVFNNLVEKQVESVFFELPFSLRYKSQPYKDKRMFVTGGLKYNYDIASSSKSRQADTLIQISPHDFQWEVGVGMQFFYPFFIFSPEIKYSRGLGNILIYNKNLNESKVLENVTSQIFTLTFNFEG